MTVKTLGIVNVIIRAHGAVQEMRHAGSIVHLRHVAIGPLHQDDIDLVLARLLVDIAPAPDHLIMINADESILALLAVVHLLHIVEIATDAHLPDLIVDDPLLLRPQNLYDAQPARLVHLHLKVHPCPVPLLTLALRRLYSEGNSNHYKDLLFPIYRVS